jgi:hypothetical protein
MTAKGAEDFVQVGGDGHLVFEEVLEPEIVVPVSQGNQRQEVSQANADGRFLAFRVEIVLRQRINAKMRGHC